MLEVKMVDDCYEYLVNSRHYNKVIREVPFLSRCIDMVIITQEHEMITIEFKIKNWRHALEQVRSHKLGADRAYICLPIQKPSNELVNALIDEQVGLFLYSPEEQEVFYEYMPAPRNAYKIEAFSQLLKNKLVYMVANCTS